MLIESHYDYSSKMVNPRKIFICGHRGIELNLDVFDKKRQLYQVGAICKKIASKKGPLGGSPTLNMGNSVQIDLTV
ncbi:MAG: hypothetical protein QXU18_08905 [Thermoplasmatales archaeon]